MKAFARVEDPSVLGASSPPAPVVPPGVLEAGLAVASASDLDDDGGGVAVE